MSRDRMRIPEFYKLSVEERVRAVHDRGLIDSEDFRALTSGEHTLNLDSADKMIENVVGVMGMPLGLGMNLVVNDKQYIVPMVVEEPSVVAALSSACKLVRACGGFKTEATDPILIGQIQSRRGRRAPSWFSPPAERCRIRGYFRWPVGLDAGVGCALSGVAPESTGGRGCAAAPPDGDRGGRLRRGSPGRCRRLDRGVHGVRPRSCGFRGSDRGGDRHGRASADR